MTSGVVLTMILIAAVLIVGFVTWLLVFHRRGERAIRQQNIEQGRTPPPAA